MDSMILDDKLLDEVTARAKTSERLRMNFNLHDSLDAKRAALPWPLPCAPLRRPGFR